MKKLRNKMKSMTKQQVMRFIPYLIPTGFMLSEILQCIWGVITRDQSLVGGGMLGIFAQTCVLLVIAHWNGDLWKKEDVNK